MPTCHVHVGSGEEDIVKPGRQAKNDERRKSGDPRAMRRGTRGGGWEQVAIVVGGPVFKLFLAVAGEGRQ